MTIRVVITVLSSHATKSLGTGLLFEGQVEVKAKVQSWCLAPLEESLVIFAIQTLL